jgi:hypothetical protein
MSVLGKRKRGSDALRRSENGLLLWEKLAVELVYDDCTRHVRRVSVIIENLIASVYI